MTAIKRPMINDALRLLRLYLGLSQKEVAQETGLSQSLISEIETGAKSASFEALHKYSSAFKISMSKLLFFAEELSDEPVAKKGKLIIASRVLRLLDALSPRDKSDGI